MVKGRYFRETLICDPGMISIYLQMDSLFTNGLYDSYMDRVEFAKFRNLSLDKSGVTPRNL